MLVAAGSLGLGVLASGAAPRKAAEKRFVSAEARDTARQVLAPRARPSARAERARAIRRDLEALRSELAALTAGSQVAAAYRIEAIRGRIVRRYVGENHSEETLFERHGDGPGAQVIQLVNDLEAVGRDTHSSLDDVPRLIAELDRALAVPPAEPTNVRTVTPLVPGDSR
jgi:hypothetical protein